MRVYSETFSPTLVKDAQRLARLGVKVSEIDPRLRFSENDSNPGAVPFGINGEYGKGEALVITTTQFDGIFGGTAGF
jgi:hypothetical protein